MELNNDIFEKQLREHSGPVLLFFVSEVCGPSYAMQMTIDELESLPVSLCEIDIQAQPAIGMHYKIRGTPLLMLTQNAKPITSRIGTQSAKQIEEWLEKSLDKLKGQS